ncbi:MAG: hypothetical protein WA089_00410, partial [Anaerolineae bacterium]
RRPGLRPRRWTPGGTPVRCDFNRQPTPPTSIASTQVDARRNAREVRFQSPTGVADQHRVHAGGPTRRDFNRYG